MKKKISLYGNALVSKNVLVMTPLAFLLFIFFYFFIFFIFYFLSFLYFHEMFLNPVIT